MFKRLTSAEGRVCALPHAGCFVMLTMPGGIKHRAFFLSIVSG